MEIHSNSQSFQVRTLLGNADRPRAMRVDKREIRLLKSQGFRFCPKARYEESKGHQSPPVRCRTEEANRSVERSLLLIRRHAFARRCATSAESSVVVINLASANALNTAWVVDASSDFRINSSKVARRRVSAAEVSSPSSVSRRKILRAIDRCSRVNWSVKTFSAVSAIAPRTPPEEV